MATYFSQIFYQTLCPVHTNLSCGSKLAVV